VNLRRSGRAAVVLLAAALALGVAAQLAFAGSPGDFAQPVTSPEPAGNSPAGIALSDFNKDGKPDLAVANFSADTVTILLGAGNGNFTPAGSSPELTSPTPVSVASGDINADGNPDLAVSNAGTPGKVNVLLGQGNGNFTEAPSSPETVGSGPRSVVLADFDSDGDLDLATANDGTGDVTIMLGDGSGDFTAAGTSPEVVGGEPSSITVGDFKGDGKPDLAVTDLMNDGVIIMVGDGTGDFTVAGTSPESVGVQPISADASDFNGDGRVDLAVVNQGSGDLDVLLGDGSGDFAPSSTSPEQVDSNPQDVVAADINGDGDPDLATSDFTFNHVTVLLGNGVGDFSEPATSPETVGSHPVAIAAGDVNNDGKPDLVTGNSGSANASILLNQTSHTDLGVAMSDSADPAAVGATLTYTLTVTNRGPDDSTGGVLTDDIPSGVAFVSASTGCSALTGDVICVVGALPAGSSRQVQIRVRPTSPSPPTLSNSATIDANEQDLNAGNDATTELTSVISSGVSCLGQVATIVGTGNGETITGNGASETIASLGGDDAVFAVGGNDLVCGGGGDDSLILGNGLDSASGGAGDDTLSGGKLNDTLRGGSGADVLKGDEENDTLNGNDGDDALAGGPGTDTCNGGSGTDTATGCETTTGVP
jgi:uncharacterized repeat protein (TIGR01451 family)